MYSRTEKSNEFPREFSKYAEMIPQKYYREWPRYCRKVYWSKMVQNAPDDLFGQNDLILNRILAFAGPKWTFGLKRSILVHLGPPTILWPFLLLSCIRASANTGIACIRTIAHFPKNCFLHVLVLCRGAKKKNQQHWLCSSFSVV